MTRAGGSALNAEITLPVTIAVRVSRFDEPNAFFDPELREIIIYEGFAPHLRELAEI